MKAPVVIASAALLAACAYNEDLGRSQLLLVDDSALATAAAQTWTQTLASGKQTSDAAAKARVRRVGERIVNAAGLGGLNWEYAVFEDATPNAFALPGGRIGVNTGLLTLVANDDQLAAIIGHEVGHTQAHHAAERLSQNTAAQLALGVAQGAVGGASAERIAAFGGAGAQLGVLLPFSRKHELEADRLGVDYMHAAGYRPAEAVKLWEAMAAQSGARSAEFMSTHPSDATRIAALRDYLRSRGWL